jgi:hypothetical protein
MDKRYLIDDSSMSLQRAVGVEVGTEETMQGKKVGMKRKRED